MTALAWDTVAERLYETGIDRGVLFSTGNPAVVWNGLVSVTETGSPETKEHFYEGLKVLVRVVPGSYSGKIEAFTYPDALDTLTGIVSLAPGIRVHDSRSKPFHLTYRTRIGSALDGVDHGYKIHLVYNLLARSDDVVAKTIGQNVEPTPFSWSISGMQKFVAYTQPLDHISIDSRHVDPTWLTNLENQIYGTAGSDPVMPLPSTLVP